MTVSPGLPSFPDDPDSERSHLFRFEKTAPDRFRTQPLPSGLLRLYGGMIVAQALEAMRKTVTEDRQAHALHLFYQKPGRTDLPLEFMVERDTDGRSFSHRRVAVSQRGAPIAYAMGSFQTDEAGAAHQDPMPDVPGPEALAPLPAILADRFAELPERHHPFWCRRQQFEWRPLEPFPVADSTPRPARRHFWLRANTSVDGPLHVHQCLLAYASDTLILQTGLRPLGIAWTDDRLQTSSLDHAIWFHNPFRVDDWMLYALDSPAASAARVLGTGSLYRRDGVLAATVVQQGLVRMLETRREGKI